jgi:hypothetical protein
VAWAINNGGEERLAEFDFEKGSGLLGPSGRSRLRKLGALRRCQKNRAQNEVEIQAVLTFPPRPILVHAGRNQARSLYGTGNISRTVQPSLPRFTSASSAFWIGGAGHPQRATREAKFRS